MNQRARSFNGLGQWLRLGGLFCLLLVRPALATDALWPPADAFGPFDYTVPGNPPPQIDAFAVDIENEFTINFEATTINPEIFETLNTINYTNNGLMAANCPIATNGAFLSLTPGCGFLFDKLTTSTGLHSMAGTFYNAGDVRANSVIDTGTNFFFLTTVGKFNAWATNILNPGTVTVGDGGLIQFTGQNVDLTRSDLAVEGITTFFDELGILGITGFFNANLISLDFGIGTDTNADWDPGVDLQPTFAISSEFNSQNFPGPGFNQIIVSPSIPYFHLDILATNYALTRAVFLNANPGSNVNQTVYFGGNPVPNLGPGFVTVQFSSAYIDPATGLTTTNYLYLNDLYVRGANTNNQAPAGIPLNFTFTELNGTPASFSTAPAVTSFPLIAPGIVSNNYSYVDVKFTPSTVTTNASTQNPSGALTNLPGRIQIAASHDLDLTLARMSGQNYTSLSATNQFKGSGGAAIFSPYSDIYLGVTNGSLSVSNLLAPNVPHWSGALQAWSSDWITVSLDINGNSFTNEYRVMLVNPNVAPTTAPIVQDLTLHSTNIFISDTFNVIRKLYIDATAMTLTTNVNTGGFGSPDGELNWLSPITLNSVQFPNLRWVTNNGAIRAGNLAVFGSPSGFYGAFINYGILADQGSTIFTTNFLNSGVILNGIGSFALQSLTTTLTNCYISAGGNVSITTASLVTSNLTILAGKALNLTVTNQLTDLDTTIGNTNTWSVGTQAQGVSPGVYLANGFNLPLLPANPAMSDLRYIGVTNTAPLGKLVNNLWAALDYGAVPAGFTNNVEVGRLVLDPLGKAPGTLFYFSGTGASNAIYVDQLELRDSATNRDSFGNVTNLSFNTNLVIYYAQAIQSGISVAEKLNHKNGDHLRWVPTYAGVFSSTNLVSPPGVTNTVNAALAQSSDIDSDGDGIANGSDPTPFFTPDQMNFTLTVTNLPPKSARLQWVSIANGTNYVYYKTNLLSPTWLLLTNPFPSPLIYPSPPSNIFIFDALTNTPRFYQVKVQPWLTGPF